MRLSTQGIDESEVNTVSFCPYIRSSVQKGYKKHKKLHRAMPEPAFVLAYPRKKKSDASTSLRPTSDADLFLLVSLLEMTRLGESEKRSRPRPALIISAKK